MARVKGPFKISGSVGNNTFYSLPGSDQVYLRTKSGPSKKKTLKKGNGLLYFVNTKRSGRRVYYFRAELTYLQIE